MKVQEAKNRLSGYAGNELYQEASKLYREETDSRIQLRSQDKPPSRNVIEGIVNEMKPWMEKVGAGLPWYDNESLQMLIEWQTGRTWVRYGITDPRVEGYRKRARLEILKGTPLPLAKALTPESLDALASQMLAEMGSVFEKHLPDDEEKHE